MISWETLLQNSGILKLLSFIEKHYYLLNVIKI